MSVQIPSILAPSPDGHHATRRIGVSICQMFALPAQDLFFKWEAANFNSKAAFTLAAARDLKAQIQREKERLAESQRRARANLAGALRSAPRGGGAGILNIGARYGGGGVGMPVKAELGQGERRKALVAGPSRVKYEGPQMSEEARRGRACKCLHLSAYCRLIQCRQVHVRKGF